jgi:hypothetical protein
MPAAVAAADVRTVSVPMPLALPAVPLSAVVTEAGGVGVSGAGGVAAATAAEAIVTTAAVRGARTGLPWVREVKPLRDLLVKPVALYSYFLRLPVAAQGDARALLLADAVADTAAFFSTAAAAAAVDGATTCVDPRAVPARSRGSLGRLRPGAAALTASFLRNLQAGIDATIPNVVRTAEKLASVLTVTGASDGDGAGTLLAGLLEEEEEEDEGNSCGSRPSGSRSKRTGVGAGAAAAAAVAGAGAGAGAGAKRGCGSGSGCGSGGACGSEAAAASPAAAQSAAAHSAAATADAATTPEGCCGSGSCGASASASASTPSPAAAAPAASAEPAGVPAAQSSRASGAGKSKGKRGGNGGGNDSSSLDDLPRPWRGAAALAEDTAALRHLCLLCGRARRPPPGPLAAELAQVAAIKRGHVPAPRFAADADAQAAGSSAAETPAQAPAPAQTPEATADGWGAALCLPCAEIARPAGRALAMMIVYHHTYTG